MATKYSLSRQARTAFDTHGVTSFLLDQHEFDSTLVYIDMTELYGMEFPYALWTRIPTQQKTDQGLVAKVSVASKAYKNVPQNTDRLVKTGDNLEGVLFDFEEVTIPQFNCCQDYITPVYRDATYVLSETEEAKYHKRGVLSLNPNTMRNPPLNAMTLRLPESFTTDNQTVYIWTKANGGTFPKIVIGRENMTMPSEQKVDVYAVESSDITINFYWKRNGIGMPYLSATCSGEKRVANHDVSSGSVDQSSEKYNEK